MENLHGGGTGVVAVVEPALDAGAVVGNAGGEADGGFHDVEGYGAAEEAGNGDVEIVSNHGGEAKCGEREREGADKKGVFKEKRESKVE